METLRLNLGAGEAELPGYENLDLRNGHDIRKLKYQSNSVEEVRASHVLEHFGSAEIGPVLHEWVRVLRPGGVLKLAVPDFRYIVERYQAKATDEPLMSYLMGGQTDENDFHKSVFDEDGLRSVMEQIGLIDIKPWQNEGHQDCASLPVSLNLQGVKSSTKLTSNNDCRILPGVMAIMSVPRVGFIDNMMHTFRALPLLGIPLMKASGVFWGQCMESMMQNCLDSGTKYILSIDYDTLYTKEDVIALYDLMESNPEVDALCPVQMKRESTTALFTLRSKAGEIVDKVCVEEFRKPIIPINSGHFGLTMIRVDSLKSKMKKPWFRHVPDTDGHWGEGRIDEDCSFWANLHANGGQLYQANHVMVGHMELLVSWPGKNLTPIYQRLTEYEQKGRPQGEMLCDLFS